MRARLLLREFWLSPWGRTLWDDGHARITSPSSRRESIAALRRGLRGLKGGVSLACLLTKYRGARHRAEAPPLSLEQVLAADAHPVNATLLGRFVSSNDNGPVTVPRGLTVTVSV